MMMFRLITQHMLSSGSNGLKFDKKKDFWAGSITLYAITSAMTDSGALLPVHRVNC